MKWRESGQPERLYCPIGVKGAFMVMDGGASGASWRNAKAARDTGKQQQQPRRAHLIPTLLGPAFGSTLISPFTGELNAGWLAVDHETWGASTYDQLHLNLINYNQMAIFWMYTNVLK